jgi:hypothetical protein
MGQISLIAGDARLWVGASLGLAKARLPIHRPRLYAALAELPDLPARSEEPVFILAAGWRSGSTLVQRMVNSTKELLVWGEPFSEANLVERLRDSVLCFDPDRGRSHGKSIESFESATELSSQWTANLTPPRRALLEGHRELLDRTFKKPAAELGFVRWGLKEVKLDGEAALYLKKVYPAAKFIFVVRDPVDAWRSFRPTTRRPWPYDWPRGVAAGPYSYARLWDRLASSLLDAAPGVDALLIRYEELSSERTITAMQDYLDVRINREVLAQRTGTSVSRRYYRMDLPEWEKRLVRRKTHRTLSRLYNRSSS